MIEVLVFLLSVVVLALAEARWRQCERNIIMVGDVITKMQQLKLALDGVAFAVTERSHALDRQEASMREWALVNNVSLIYKKVGNMHVN